MSRQSARRNHIHTASNVSATSTSQDPDIAYQRTREGLIDILKVVKAMTEAVSFLGPLKATCEISLLALETTKAVNENTKGLEQLRDSLSAHVAILDEAYTQAVDRPSMDQMPDALKDFDNALREYVVGLKNIITRINELMQTRAGGIRGLLRTITDARIEAEKITDYKKEITDCMRLFEDTTKICQAQLQLEVWKMARLGHEVALPMGTQHDKCLPGTRGAILQEIRQWCQDPAAHERIFWLCDVGGSGKSTIALTICEEWDNTKGIVVGRFFFSKNARKTSETKDFCSNVADDIGSQNRTVMKEIKYAIEEDPRLVERTLRHQFAKLIEGPLRYVNDDIILVVDALDECNKDMRVKLLNLLLEKLSSMANLKLFITSRPESDITAILQGRPIVRGIQFKIHGKGERSNLDDITTYADTYLAGVLDAPVRQQLVERSNGLFIWIATAHRELKKANGPDAVETTLKSLLTRGKGGDINQVYDGFIRRILKESSLEVIRKVMGTILILFEPVSTEALSRLAEVAHVQLQCILMSMESVFRVENVVEFLHPTFREYLLSGHNAEMRFDMAAIQSSLAVSVLQALKSDLKEDICGICEPGEPYPNNADVSDLNERLSRVWRKSPALNYSIKYWGLHTAAVVANKQVAKALRAFLETGTLYLIELLSLTRQMHLIRNFEEVRKSFQRLDGFEVELCRDVLRLVQRHQRTLEESGLHIYSSGLLFLPRKTKLWTIYESKHSDRLPKIVGPPSEYWPSHQLVAEHIGHVICVAFCPDGSRIVSGSEDRTLRLYDATTSASIAELRGHTGLVRCVAFSPDGLRIVSGSRDRSLRLWNAMTGASIMELKGHTGPVSCLAFSPSGLHIASGSLDNTVRLWDVMTGANIAQLRGHTAAVRCLAFSLDGLRVASGSLDEALRLWDATNGTSISELKGHTGPVWCLAFSPDRLHIASGSTDETLRLWNATTSICIAELKGHTDPVQCLAFSPDGLRIASGSLDKTLRLWDTTNGMSIAELGGHTDTVSCLAFSPDGLRLASGSLDKTLRLWDAKNGTSIAELKGHTGLIWSLAFSPDGMRITSGSEDTTLRLWDATTGASIGEPKGHNDPVQSLALSPDGLRIVSGSRDETLRLWDATTGASIAELRGHTDNVTCLVFSPDGLRIASASVDKTLRLWDTTTGTSIAELRGHTGPVQCLAFSPNGLSIASGSLDKTVRLWDTKTGASIAELKGHTDTVWCLAFSPDGLRIASGSLDRVLLQWDVMTASSLGVPYRHTNPIKHLHFNGDGYSIQLGDGTLLKAFQDRFHRFLSPPSSIGCPDVLVDQQSRTLWHNSCRYRRYRIPPEIKWAKYVIHGDKATFGLENGQVFAIDFTDLVLKRT